MEHKLDLSFLVLILALIAGLCALLPGSTTPVEPPVIPDPPPVVIDPLPVNAPPIAFEPIFTGTGSWREFTTIDLRHRLHGCDSGGDWIWQTGAYDPDGDLLEYYVKATGPDNQGNTTTYAIFDVDGNRVDGRWLPVDYFGLIPSNAFVAGSPPEQDAVVYCFIGHSGDTPLHPMSTVVGPACDLTPWPTPEEPTTTSFGTLRFIYSVRDPQGEITTAIASRPISGRPCP